MSEQPTMSKKWILGKLTLGKHEVQKLIEQVKEQIGEDQFDAIKIRSKDVSAIMGRQLGSIKAKRRFFTKQIYELLRLRRLSWLLLKPLLDLGDGQAKYMAVCCPAGGEWSRKSKNKTVFCQQRVCWSCWCRKIYEIKQRAKQIFGSRIFNPGPVVAEFLATGRVNVLEFTAHDPSRDLFQVDPAVLRELNDIVKQFLRKSEDNKARLAGYVIPTDKGGYVKISHPLYRIPGDTVVGSIREKQWKISFYFVEEAQAKPLVFINDSYIHVEQRVNVDLVDEIVQSYQFPVWIFNCVGWGGLLDSVVEGVADTLWQQSILGLYAASLHKRRCVEFVSGKVPVTKLKGRKNV